MATIATLSVLLESKGRRRFNADMAKAAAAVVAVVVGLDRLLDRGSKVLPVTQAFTRRVGDQTAALQQLRSATHGLISDYELMRQTNTALTLGAAENVEQFAQMASAAQVLGRSLGIDAASALDSLTTGIGRQSRMMLDNLGIIVNAEEAYRKYADAMGKATAELTELERKEAFRTEALRQLNAQVETLGGVVLNAADQWKALKIEMGNAIDEIAGVSAGSSVLSNVLVGVRYQLALWMGDISGARNLLVEFAEASDRASRAESYTNWRRLREIIAGTAEEVAKLSPTEKQRKVNIVGRPADLDDQIKRLGDLSRGVGDLSNEYFEGNNALQTYRLGLMTVGVAANSTEQQVKSLRSEVRGLSSDLSAIAGILGFIPGAGQLARFVGNASSLLGLLGRFASDEPVGGGDTDASKVTSSSPVMISVGPASDPMTIARDQQWLRALRESNLNLRAQGA